MAVVLLFLAHSLLTTAQPQAGSWASNDETAAISRMAKCKSPVCLKDAFYTLHSASRGARFFFHARMLQLFRRNRAAEEGLLETLPATAAEASEVISFASVTIAAERERKVRDEIARTMMEIYSRAASRHGEYAERFAAAGALLRALGVGSGP